MSGRPPTGCSKWRTSQCQWRWRDWTTRWKRTRYGTACVYARSVTAKVQLRSARPLLTMAVSGLVAHAQVSPGCVARCREELGARAAACRCWGRRLLAEHRTAARRLAASALHAAVGLYLVFAVMHWRRQGEWNGVGWGWGQGA